MREQYQAPTLRPIVCEGCGEHRPVRWWFVWYQDGSTGEARYCASCGALAAAGQADQVTYAEPLTLNNQGAR